MDLIAAMLVGNLCAGHYAGVEALRTPHPLNDFAASLRQPSTLMIGEVFKAKDGNIRQIEAVLASVPYKMGAGW